MTDLTPQQEFAKALAAFQAELPSVGKDQTATIKSDKGQFTYSFADLTKITDKAFPLLSKHGLAFTAPPDVRDGEFGLAFELMHTGGHSKSGFYPIPKGTAQQIGSAITYARRYCLCAITGIAPGGEDDDGAKASEARFQPRQQGNGHVNSGTASVKAQIWNAARAKGWSQSDLEIDFASTHEGLAISSADETQLAAYAEVLAS